MHKNQPTGDGFRLGGKTWLCSSGVVAVLLALTAAGWAEPPEGGDEPAQMIRVSIEPETDVVLIGRPVWVVFHVTNLLDEPVALQAPDAEPASEGPSQMGLPLPHIFSGTNHSALDISSEDREVGDMAVSVRPSAPVPPLALAPHGSVGMRVELTQYYRTLKRPGRYTLVWKPYHGLVQSAPRAISVLSPQRVIMNTDYGEIRMELFYAKAPRHVANFIDLVDQGFYNNLTFHRVISGGIIQGGDPTGGGQGARPDGKRLKAEFNDTPFDRGIVGMARSPDNPDSASCQFFICLGRQPGLDGKQTAFAQVTGDKSFETLDKIAAVPTDSRDRPMTKVRIRTVSLESVQDRGDTVSPTKGTPDGAPQRPMIARLADPARTQTSPAHEPQPAISRTHTPATRPAQDAAP